MSDNAKTLENGFAKGLRMIEDVIYNSLWGAAVSLLRYVGEIHGPAHQGWSGFTGNTQLSYMCGIYQNGRLVGVVNQDNWRKPPVMSKIKGPKFLMNPYEGNKRGLPTKNWSVIPTDGDFGYNTSLNFLKGYKAPKNKMCLVMTTGTEYSEYIETVQHLDVLTDTFTKAPEKINMNWKKIDD